VIQREVGASPDGDFGPLTRASVSAFQRAHHLLATGRVDAATWAALPPAVALAACGSHVSATGSVTFCPTLAVRSTGPAVAVAQRAVRVATDGDFGPITRGAVEHAQVAHLLHVTGTVTPSTWRALGLVGTPACTRIPASRPVTRTPTPKPRPGPVPAPTRPSRPQPPSDAAQQGAIHAKVLRLVAGLRAEPGRAADANAERALQFALSQRGKPYRWGATGPSSYDCSGLVLAAYRSTGIGLLRTAAEQYTQGEQVALDHVQPGDIVFYASDLTKPGTIYHDAIYVGSDLIVNAPYTGQKVRVEGLFTTDLLPTAVRPSALLALPIRVGSTGWSVRQLQTNLDLLGADLAVDGDDGPLTAAAVEHFQRGARLTPNGLVDDTTWTALAAALKAQLG
jgi:cell wall-associated NlpC family hydrolase